jgi:hypothetical protein
VGGKGMKNEKRPQKDGDAPELLPALPFFLPFDIFLLTIADSFFHWFKSNLLD